MLLRASSCTTTTTTLCCWLSWIPIFPLLKKLKNRNRNLESLSLSLRKQPVSPSGVFPQTLGSHLCELIAVIPASPSPPSLSLSCHLNQASQQRANNPLAWLGGRYVKKGGGGDGGKSPSVVKVSILLLTYLSLSLFTGRRIKFSTLLQKKEKKRLSLGAVSDPALFRWIERLEICLWHSSPRLLI